MNGRKISRRAILIGAPGGYGSKYLRGVNEDLKNFQRFLLSERGGCWLPHEICIINQATLNKVLSVVRSTNADYVLVYFSGHGYTDSVTNERMICFQDHNVSDTFLFNSCRKQLVLIDACRDYPEAAIGGIPYQEEGYLSFEGPNVEIRELFDRHIEASPLGRTVVYGTLHNTKAGDTALGGVFTLALLHVGYRMKSDKGYIIATIEDIIYHVPSVIEKRGRSQKPEIIRHDGCLNIPFAVGMPMVEKTIQSSERPLPQLNSSNINWGAIAIGGVILAAAFGAFDQK